MKKLIKWFVTYFFVDEEEYDEGIRPHITDYMFMSIPVFSGLVAFFIVLGWA